MHELHRATINRGVLRDLVLSSDHDEWPDHAELQYSVTVHSEYGEYSMSLTPTEALVILALRQ